MSDSVVNDEEAIIFQTVDGQVVDARELVTAFTQAEEGAAQVLDPDGNVITVTAEQLAEAGIDLANLGEDQVALILHLASQKAQDDKRVMEPEAKRSMMDKLPSDYDHPDKSAKFMASSSSQDRGFISGDELDQYHESNGGASYSSRSEESRSQRTPTGFALIGSEIEVRRGNRTVLGTVRYCRRGIGYKVEFQDGRYEWVTEDQIVFKQNDPVVAEDVQKKRDHEYLTGNSDPFARSSTSFQSCRPPGPSGISMAGSPSASDRHFSGKEVHDGSAGGEDFSCPICNQKVYSKEPSYIVIRIPACQTCAESKILVLDEN